MAWPNKTPSIQEGGTAKNLTCAKLKTAKQGGGSMFWVPEEEVQLGTKSINKNGTYKASSDDKYGYSQVIVNVSGGSGSADSSGKPTGTTPPGGSGSAVVGVDPETGNEQVIGVDESGNLVTTPIPSSIKVITPPTKTDYTEGETMDYSGIVVGLKKKDGTTFTDSDYPNGHIPAGELVFPVTTAPSSGSSSGAAGVGYTNGAGMNFVKMRPTTAYSWGNSSFFIGEIIGYDTGTLDDELYASGNGVRSPLRLFLAAEKSIDIYLTQYHIDGDSDMWIAAHTDEPCRVGFASKHYTGSDNNGNSTYNFTGLYGFSSAYITGYSAAQGTNWVMYAAIKHEWTVPTSNADPTQSAFVKENYSVESGYSAEIPVEWRSPYDGKTMQDVFEIITSSSGSEESNASSGSGGGGTF